MQLVIENRLKSTAISGAIRFQRVFIREERRVSQALKAEDMQSVEGDGFRVGAADPKAIYYNLMLTAGSRLMEFVESEWIEVVKENRNMLLKLIFTVYYYFMYV